MFLRGFLKPALLSNPRTPPSNAFLPRALGGTCPIPVGENAGYDSPLAHNILWRGVARRQTVANLGAHQRIFYSYALDFVLDLKTISSRAHSAAVGPRGISR